MCKYLETMQNNNEIWTIGELVEAIIFFIPIAVAILATLFLMLGGINKNQKNKNLFVQLSIVNLIVFILGVFLWFQVSRDGVAQQMTGLFIYGGVFALIEIVIALILYIRKRKEIN